MAFSQHLSARKVTLYTGYPYRIWKDQGSFNRPNIWYTLFELSGIQLCLSIANAQYTPGIGEWIQSPLGNVFENVLYSHPILSNDRLSKGMLKIWSGGLVSMIKVSIWNNSQIRNIERKLVHRKQKNSTHSKNQAQMNSILARKRSLAALNMNILPSSYRVLNLAKTCSLPWRS